MARFWTKHFKTFGIALGLVTLVSFYQNCAQQLPPGVQEEASKSTLPGDNIEPPPSGGDIPEELPAPPLEISPNMVALEAPATQQFSASGGVPPYSYEIASGSSIISPSGLLTAANMVDTTVVRVVDSKGTVQIATVTVSLPLSVSFAPAQPTVNDLVELTATGGKAPYTYKILAGTGMLNGTQYTSAAMASSVLFEVKDAAGKVVQLSVSIVLPQTVNVYRFEDFEGSSYISLNPTPQPGYNLAGVVYKLLKTSSANTKTIYFCGYFGTSSSLWTSTSCPARNASSQGIAGYVYKTQLPNTTPLTLEGITGTVGYLPPQ